MSVGIGRKAGNRALAASNQAGMGVSGFEADRLLKWPILRLGYPVSANRYWRTFRGRTVRSSEADAYKDGVRRIAWQAGLMALTDPVEVRVTLHPKLTKRGAASRTRMDLDNCIKVTLDALNGVAYRDDSQVVRLVAEVGPAIQDGGLSVSVTEVK